MINLQNNQNQLQFELFCAAKSGDINRMQELIIQGANPFFKDENNLTAFHYAIKADMINAGLLLLDLINTITKAFKEGAHA